MSGKFQICRAKIIFTLATIARRETVDSYPPAGFHSEDKQNRHHLLDKPNAPWYYINVNH